jgi:fibronectin type 3 domain-containing protein
MRSRIHVTVLIAGLMLAVTIFPGPSMATTPEEGFHQGTDASGMEVPSTVVPPTPGGQGRFIENLGQWDDRVRFVTRGAGGEVAFHDDGMMYLVPGAEGPRAVKVTFQGAGEHGPVGVDETGSVHNYIFGNDPSGWVTGAKEYRSLEYRDVWTGIDVRYYFSDQGFKYDVIVGPDADPSSIGFDVEGHAGLAMERDVMAITLEGGNALLDRDLVAWYEDGESVDASFRTAGDGYGFVVDKAPGRTLIIDPLVITRSTYLGGTYTDIAEDMTMDDEGNVYITGSTVSTDYPVTAGAYCESYLNEDLVVTKMDRDLSNVIWSTYIGGTAEDVVRSMALDSAGNVHLVGTTRSGDFPVSDGALQPTQGGPYSPDLYVLKLAADGGSLVYSTYIGGMWAEKAGDIAVKDGKAYVVAMTESADFPFLNVTGGMYAGAPLVMVLSEDGSRLEAFQSWKVTRMIQPNAMHLGEDGTVTITGMTSSPDLPTTPGAYIENASWPAASFVIQCDPWTNTTHLCTYFGLLGVYADEVALDAEGNIYLAGLAYSFGQGLPLTEGAWCTTFKGTRDEFVTKLDANGSKVLYSTLVGGDSYDWAGDLEVTENGNAVFVGWSWQADNYNTSGNAHDDEAEGSHEGFVLVLDGSGSRPIQSTYLGGRFGDYVTAVEITSEGTLMLAGYTESKGFPTTDGAFQEELAGDRDMFVTELAVLSPPSRPLNLVARGGEGNITLNWDPPVDVNGFPIVNYTVQRENDEGDMEVVHVQGPETSFIDTEVEYGKYYVYRVSAFNGKGMSLPSNKATARSITVPDPPGNLTGRVNDDHIMLEWKTPNFTGGLDLGDYNLYRAEEDGELELIAHIHQFLVSFVDPDVTDRRTYTYVLAATNEYGESRGNPSVTLRMTGVPTPPRSLDFTYGNRYIELTWEEPEEDYDLPVVRYHVYRAMGEEPSQLMGVVRSPALVLRDKTVDVGVTYRYHVVAENGKGMSDPSAEVEAKTMVAPDPPQDVEAVANELFIRITWSAPGFDGASPLTSYRIYLADHELGDILLGNVNVLGVEEPRLVFLHEQAWDGLPREYLVTAINVEGESGPTSAIWTQSFQVPTAPLSLAAEGGDEQVSLTWSYPQDDGGAPVFSFDLFRRMVGSQTFIEVATLPASNLRFVDDTAINGVEYAYWATATNLAGESEPSIEVTVMPAGPPGAPTQVSVQGLNGSVRISWNAPDWSGGMPIQGYRVYGISEGSQAELLAELGPLGTDHVQESLVNGMVYLYAVRAYSVVGESEMSPVVEGRPVGAPSAPQALIAVWMDGMVYVTWSSPMSDGGAPVEGFRLSRDDWDPGRWADVQALEMMYSDEEVERNGTYTYRVHAYNVVGDGPVVNITITVPPEAKTAEEDPVEYWPWIVLVAAGVALLAALAQRGRSGRPAGSRQVEEEITEASGTHEDADDAVAEDDVVVDGDTGGEVEGSQGVEDPEGDEVPEADEAIDEEKEE